jgi:tRNA pseudouridine38-40 synthase
MLLPAKPKPTFTQKSLRYFFHIAYNGSNYRGWQKLPQHNSVQVVIETELSRILKKKVEIVGCGRTDSHVHAAQFFFHADLPEGWDFDLMFRLNKNLPDDIAIFDIIPMEGLPHARLDAVERTYNYFINNYKEPFLNGISAPYFVEDLKIDDMKKAVSLLPQYDDYQAFCKNAAMHRTTICKVTTANLYADLNGNNFRFEISANRFLSGMIRIIVGRLLAIGRGKLGVEEFQNMLVTKTSQETIVRAYPQGLFLSKVIYPFLDLPCKSALLNAMTHPSRWLPV